MLIVKSLQIKEYAGYRLSKYLVIHSASHRLLDFNKGSSSPMNEQQANDPLHGVTLEQIINNLVEFYGWDELGKRIDINCFNSNPSVKSSLKFLRKSPWARQKVEVLFLAMKNGEC